MRLVDRYERPLHDLRISVTDRCNFRCTYCMPREHFGADHVFLEREALLTYEEITLVVRSLLPAGLRKVRLTGGEPLLRKDITALIEMLRDAGPDLDLALTTAGLTEIDLSKGVLHMYHTHCMCSQAPSRTHAHTCARVCSGM